MARLERVVALRLTDPVYRAAREAAREDDRALGPFLRRLIAANVAPPETTGQENADAK
jgi:hypothetical protein